MRTTAEAQISPAAPTAEPTASRRGRAAARQRAAPGAPPQAALREPPAVAVTTVRMLRVEEGLHVLRVGELGGAVSAAAAMPLPAALVVVPPGGGEAVEIVAAYPGRGPWLGKEGGTMILRSPPGGGQVIVTAYGATDQGAGELALDLRRLDGRGEGEAAAVAADAGERAALTGTREVATEILLHIERAGDRLFPGRGWVGALGRRMQIEAFSVRPLERLAPADIEMKGFLPNGGETPWIPGGVLCGTRGRGLPLTGFAVRVAPRRADRFEVVYQGSFFAGGISQPRQNGDACKATGADDPLEAINIRLIERVAAPEETAAG